MTNTARQTKRREVAKQSGYVQRDVPADVEWAGTQLPDLNDDKAHAATLSLRGIVGRKLRAVKDAA